MKIVDPAIVNSHTWRWLKEQLEQRRADLRIQNDSDRDPIETAKLRGRIAELTALIDADQVEAEVPKDPPPA